MRPWNPGVYQENAAFVATLGRSVVELLAPQTGERILDPDVATAS